MTDLWGLPRSVWIGGVEYGIHSDYRDILTVFRYLSDPDVPAWLGWRIALRLFYREPVPERWQKEAMERLAWFIRCGREEQAPGPKLIDWQQDASVIVADVNKVAGMEVRGVAYLHWWSFMAFFDAVGEGQLATLVAVREKLRTGKKLEKWEQEYYRRNKSRVDMKKQYSAEERMQRERLERMLDGR